MNKIDNLLAKWRKKIKEQQGEIEASEDGMCEKCGLELHPNLPCEEISDFDKRIKEKEKNLKELKKKRKLKEKQTKTRKKSK